MDTHGAHSSSPPINALPFVGRSADIALLQAQLKAAAKHSTRLLLLTAPAGGGKTQLVEHFLSEASDHCTIIRGRCWDNWAAVSYHPLHEALHQLPTSPTPLHPSLRAFLCDETDGVNDALQPQVFFPALCDLLGQYANQQPICLFIDDLHWADEGTLEWLDFCLHQKEELPLLLVTACRSEELTGLTHFLERQHDIGQQGRLIQQELEPLTRDEVAKLALEVIPETSWDESEIEHIWYFSEGNPLLALEEIRAHGGGDVLSAHPDPLRSRLQALPAETRDLLCQAAVIGERFAVEPLATALDREPLATARALDELWHEHHLIGPDAEGYCFAHARYRELLLESMSPALRRQYHARLATQGEQLAPEQHTYHLVQSSDVRTGVRALLKQGDELRYRANWRDVLRFYTEALWRAQDQDGDPTLLLEIYQRIGDLQLLAAGEPELARGYYEVALRWAREPRHQALLLARLAETFLHTSNGYRHLERALQLLGDDGPEPLRNWLEMRLLESRTILSPEQLRQSTEKARRVGEAEELPLEFRQQAHSMYLWNSVRFADDPISELAQHEEQLKRLPEHGWQTAQYYGNLANASLGAGQPTRALDYARHARELFVELKQEAMSRELASRELSCYLFTHQFDRLRTEINKLLQDSNFADAFYTHLYEMLCKTWPSDRAEDGTEWAVAAIGLMHHLVPKPASSEDRTTPNNILHRLGAAERVLRQSGQGARFQQAIAELRVRLKEGGCDADVIWYFDKYVTRPPIATAAEPALGDWKMTPGHAHAEVLRRDGVLYFRALPLQGFSLLNMPRLTRRVRGDFIIEATVQPGSQVQEGIHKSWRLKGEGKTNPLAVGAGSIGVICDLHEKLRLSAHTDEPSEVFMEVYSGDHYETVGRGLLDDDRPVRLRMERRGALFSTYAANEGDTRWYGCGQVELPHWQEVVQVGLWGVSPVDLYPAQTERAETRIWNVALECTEQISTPPEEELALLPKVRYAADFPSFVAAAPATLALLDETRRAARAELPVLLCGETGTGKELIARALHRCGPRAEGPFVPLNCAAIPSPLLESELFGHVRGAFTGAYQSRGGLFEAADGGILFLDEIGDASLELQARLLRVLDDKEVRRVGTNRTRRVDVRIVAATNRDLVQRVVDGRFRRDLYFRLRGIELTLPPLDQRRADIPALVAHGLRELSRQRGVECPTITQAAMETLHQHPWPGNVRELLHEIERAAEAADFTIIRRYHFAHLTPAAAQQRISTASERDQLAAALRATGGNIKETARRLGISRNTVYRRLRQHSIDRSTL